MNDEDDIPEDDIPEAPYEDKELTVAEIAECFAPELSINAIRRIIRNGNISTRKEGRVRYTNIGDIECYLDTVGYGYYYPSRKSNEPRGEWMAYAQWQRRKEH